MVTFGEKLRNLRINSGLTQEELGKKLGVTDKAISRYENDYAEPDFKLLKKIANLYKVDPNFLLSFYDSDNKIESMEVRHGEFLIIEAYRKCDKAHQKIIRNLLKEFSSINSDSDEPYGFIHED